MGKIEEREPKLYSKDDILDMQVQSPCVSFVSSAGGVKDERP